MASSSPSPLPTTAPLKVLIVRVGAMGDVLHGLPGVAALRAQRPDALIGWAVEPRWKDLLVDPSGHGPIVDRIHPVPTREWKHKPFSVRTLRSIAQLRRELRGVRYDVCVDLQGSIRSAAIGRMAEAAAFYGPARPRESQAKALYRERVPVHAPNVIDQACELLQAALPEPSTLRAASVILPTDSAAEQWSETKLRDFNVAPGEFILLSPAAGWGAKQWPAERYRKLIQHLEQQGIGVLINGGSAADAPVLAALAAGSPARVVDCSVAQLIALTRRARLVVGGDSGPVHLAAALGRPVVALFGPTDPARNGPYFPGATVKVLRHVTSRLNHARHAETETGLAQISEQEVLTAVVELLAGEPRHG